MDLVFYSCFFYNISLWAVFLGQCASCDVVTQGAGFNSQRGSCGFDNNGLGICWPESFCSSFWMTITDYHRLVLVSLTQAQNVQASWLVGCSARGVFKCSIWPRHKRQPSSPLIYITSLFIEDLRTRRLFSILIRLYLIHKQLNSTFYRLIPHSELLLSMYICLSAVTLFLNDNC